MSRLSRSDLHSLKRDRLTVPVFAATKFTSTIDFALFFGVREIRSRDVHIASLTKCELLIAMDGCDLCMDIISNKRLWRALEHKAVYLEDVTDVFRAHRVIRDG